MFGAYLRGLFCLLKAVRSEKRSLRVVSGKPVRKFTPFPFGLHEMRCPICGRQPHKGLTAELTERARSQGMISCEVHGPVEGDVVISLRQQHDDLQAA